MLRVGIVGASGYVGAELLRILAGHPDVVITAVTSEHNAGKPVHEVFPHLTGRFSLTLEAFDATQLSSKADLVFLALPHMTSMSAVSACLKAGLRVIDLSADFRLNNLEDYQTWYGSVHLFPKLLSEAVYGMPEINRDRIRDARLVAAPGCYPTAAILQLAPLLQQRLIHNDLIVIDAKSGISGAGRKPTLISHFSEAHDGVEAYNLGHHRHTPEIEQELCKISNRDPCDTPEPEPELKVTFTPTRVPMNRGILSTAFVRLRDPMSTEDLRAIFQEWYHNEPFVCMTSKDRLPNPHDVRGSNRCDLAVYVDQRTGWTTVLATLDNLVKGAGGQAVQSMNLMVGNLESTGLDVVGIFP
tara:strand:+ start:2647 stop:3717 length:1071 start_codon:yes stop_codon:yes gene_type:complete